jgi:hypothetical protein
LIVSDNAGDSPQTVGLSAFFPPPSVTISPKTLTFPPSTLTVTNSGTWASLRVGAVTISGISAADFTITGNTCSAAVPPGKSCTIGVAFSVQGHAPTCGETTDPVFCGQINIEDNAGDSPQAVPLRTIFVG